MPMSSTMSKKTVHSKRRLVELYKNLLEGMYGGLQRYKREHKGVDAALCQKWIGHCHKFMNAAIQKYGLNKDGKTTIENLWTPDCKYSAADVQFFKPVTDNKMGKLNEKFKLVRYEWNGQEGDIMDSFPAFESQEVNYDHHRDGGNTTNHNRPRRRNRRRRPVRQLRLGVDNNSESD